MITDTLIVMIFCIATEVQEHVKVTSEKADFVQLFKEADKEFDKIHKIDLEALKHASQEAVKSADIKTKSQREKVLSPSFFKEVFKSNDN